ncbi:MaoC/PaaZ C-terminal domain-containing protein [Pseudalkalibacillus berkeleyi]|uniref:Enoyl-CoA hydratase n=1 Tax=Pseudalkalibacillus berkeleyi TaxID=1069813 RepID=A0ABS9H259_9BACL|nr:MaoC/PaaZ C-terminal domain-containing protein [Pseudalkalibacillus berkeleyi]MCF6138196.1 enoyl-CoA hydratase [Pseudalkalibacillus berkeleyi]
MLLGKKRKLGRKIDEINVGEKLEITETIEDKDLLLYLGLTDDNNPLYIQHDYATLTPFKKPLVPQIMLTGLITSAISKYLPGPGSSILKQSIAFPKPVYHYATIVLHFEITNVDTDEHVITVSVKGYDEEKDEIINGEFEVCPPHTPRSITARTFDNF